MAGVEGLAQASLFNGLNWRTLRVSAAPSLRIPRGLANLFTPFGRSMKPGAFALAVDNGQAAFAMDAG